MDSEPHFPQDDPIMSMLSQSAGQLGAMMSEAMRPEIYAYELVGPERINEMAVQGWQVAAVVPTVAFLMQRKRGPADDAADMLAQTPAGPERRGES